MFEFLDFLRKGKMLSHYGEYWRRQIGLLTAFATPTTETSTSTALSPGNLNADPSTTTNGNLNQGNLIIANKQNPEPGDNFTIFVCGEEEVPSYHDAGITEILTCISPRSAVLSPSWPTLRDHLIVRCDDVERPMDDYMCPNEEHVKHIIHFGQDLIRRNERGQKVRLLVHCAAGISRSTAAAFLILSMKYGKGAEHLAFRHLTSIRPICHPNAAIVGHGDRLLQREGRLVHQVAVWRGHSRWFLAAAHREAGLVIRNEHSAPR
jgi:predicted protein tyrosine phosphatase